MDRGDVHHVDFLVVYQVEVARVRPHARPARGEPLRSVRVAGGDAGQPAAARARQVSGHVVGDLAQTQNAPRQPAGTLAADHRLRPPKVDDSFHEACWLRLERLEGAVELVQREPMRDEPAEIEAATGCYVETAPDVV